MTSHNLFEYLVNSLWQLPLLVLASLLVTRIARPSLPVQHALWCAALALGVLLPLRGIDWNQALDAEPAIAQALSPAETNTLAIAQFPAAPQPAPQSITRTLAALRVRSIHLQSRTIGWLIDLYAVSVALSLARLIYGWVAIRRVVESATQHPLTTLESTLLRACAERLQLKPERMPDVRFLDNPNASPMVVGIRCPVLLLPASLRQSAAHSFDDAALAAVLLHELAHVRRRDFLANLTLRVVALPIAYHPATYALQTRIRQTREMICDAHAAGVFASRSKYARSLIALAEGFVRPSEHVEAVGLFDHNGNSLEERIMKLTEPKFPLSLRLRAARIAAGAAVLVAGTGAAATLHLKASTPVVYAMQTAQTALNPVPEPPPVPQVTAPPPPTEPTRPAAPAAPTAPAGPQAPTPPAKPANPASADDTSDTQIVIRKLTPEERKQRAEAREKMKLKLKEMPQIVIPDMDMKFVMPPEFARQMAEMKFQFDSPEFKKQMEQMKLRLNSPEFKKQMDEAREQARKAMIDSPEFKKQMDEMKPKFNSPEFKKQVDEAREQARKAMIDSGEFKKQMEEMKTRMNSPEFREQLENGKKMAFAIRADDGKRAAEARKQLEDASAAIAEARKQVHDDSVQRQLDEAQRRIDQAKKTY